MESGANGAASLVGKSVGGYRLEQLLGTGAMGAVFLGRRLAETLRIIERTSVLPVELPDVAAIKVLILPWQLDAAARADFQARFVREAQTLQRLRHPNIVPVLDDGDDPAIGSAYMVLPYLPGGTLATYAAALPYPMPLGEIASVLTQIGAALDYAHSQGVVHRDIKPSNILLDGQGRVYLADFSIVRLLIATDARLTATGGVLGTPEYMAPEQSDGRSVGPAADIYSLGMVVYRLVTGRAAFSATSVMELIRLQAQEAPPPPHLLRPDLPAPCEAGILRALQKQPAQRFATASEFAYAFALGLQGQWAGGLASFVAPGVASVVREASAQTLQDGPPIQRVGQPQRRNRMGLLGGALALLLLVCVMVALLASHGVGALFQRANHNPTPGSSASQTNTTNNPATSHPVPTTAYVVGDNGTLDALDSVSGAIKWSVNIGGQPANGLPGAYLDSVSTGIVFVTAAQADPSFPDMPGVGILTAIDAQTHTILWSTHRTVIFLAAQGGDVFVSDSTGIAALNTRTDKLFWHYDEPQPYPLAFAPGDNNGVEYLSYTQNAQTAYVDAIQLSTGSRLWRSALQGLALDSLAYSNGDVYTTSRGANFAQTVEAFSGTNGQQLWSARADGAGLDIQVANGLVFVHTQGSDVSGNLLVLNAQSGQQQGGFSNHSEPGACILNPPLLVGDRVYVACSAPGNFLYAYTAGSGSLVWQGLVAGDYISVGGAQGGVVYTIGRVNGSDNATTTALQASSGGLLWQKPGAYVDAAGGVAFISDNGTLDALDAATGHMLWQNTTLGANIQALAQ